MIKSFLVTLSLLIALPAVAQERIDLTTPETKPTNAQYAIKSLIQEFDDPATGVDEGRITIALRGQNGELLTCSYDLGTVPTATTLSTALNKANLSSTYAGNATTGTLKQRIYYRLVVLNEAATVCGKSLVGTIAGSVP